MVEFIFKKIGAGLLTGIGIALGFFVVMYARDAYFDETFEPEIWEDDPPGLTISRHSTKPNMGRLTIVGTVENSSALDWNTVWITARILADDALVNNCEDTIRNLPSNTSKDFEVTCYNVSGSGLPDNVRYELKIRTGVRAEAN